MYQKEILIDSPKEKELRESLKSRSDAEALRMKRYLEMPDLSRTSGSPLQDMVSRVKAVAALKDFDVITIPEIVPANISFDLFDFPVDHPARSKSDTYYADEENILRTHDTVFWYYYLNDTEVKERIKNGEAVGTLCYGKVYRKDEIDRKHMNVFHQMGGWYLQPDSMGILQLDDLKSVLSQVVKSVFGENVKYRFNEDTFPYTDPSLEVEVDVNGEWVEILGGGMPKKSVLKKMDVEGYNGWAFGFGLERLAIISMELPDIRLFWSDDERVVKQLKLGTKFQDVSKFPPITRDISFVVDKSFEPNNYFDLIRDIGGDLVEEVSLLDKYENEEKFGKDKISYTYRVIYRSIERTLLTEEINPLQEKIQNETIQQFGADVR
jgi:phenylalanyl-tRNA synthetase alpha chain